MVPELNDFLSWPSEKVAQCVQENNLRVCVFAVNGTRRWFNLEHPDQPDFLDSYLTAMVDVQVRLSRMLFEHGLDTLVMPVFGLELLNRKDYELIALRGLQCLASDERLIRFYSECDIKVRFYGNYKELFQAPPWSDLLDAFANLEKHTRQNKKHRLFLGACAQDASESIAQLSIDFFRENARTPTRADLVRLYYGEYVDPANIFLGFDRFCTFDMPLLDVGATHLYFTVSPSAYLTIPQLRKILYDYIYARGTTAENELSSRGHSVTGKMRAFYQRNIGHTQGIGFIDNGVWYPDCQVEIPPEIQG